MRMVEAGLVRKWKRDWFADRLLCAKSLVTESPKISVLDVQSVLYVGLIGFGLALVFLALEALCRRHPSLAGWTGWTGLSGCQEDEGGEKGDRPHRAPGLHNNNNNNNNNDDDEEGGTGRGGESDFQGVYVVGGRGAEGGRGSLQGVFDFSSVDRRNHFLFDTVYSRPEDFGRLPSDAAPPPGWDRRAAKLVRISDDVKIST